MTAVFSTIPAAISLTPEGVNPVQFLLIGSLAVMIFGAGKAGFAGGVGVIATPLMLYACSPNESVAPAVMLPLLIAADYITVFMWRGQWDRRQVLLLAPGAVVGVAGGAGLLLLYQRLGGQAENEMTDLLLRLSIGVIALAFVALRAVKLARRSARRYRPDWRHAGAFGSVAGLTSTLAHAAGPVTTMYLLPQQMPKSRYVATSALFYWLLNQIKLIPYFALGMISAPTLGADLALLPAVGAGALLGRALHDRINQKWFVRVVYVLLSAIGLDLTIRSLIQLLA